LDKNTWECENLESSCISAIKTFKLPTSADALAQQLSSLLGDEAHRDARFVTFSGLDVKDGIAYFLMDIATTETE
jgi:hypothetical protein